MRSEYRQSTRKLCELVLGPLKWRFVSINNAIDEDVDAPLTPDNLIEQLRNLVDQALRDGCTRAEINAILGQYNNGDHHGDA